MGRDKKSHKHKRSSRDRENNKCMEEIFAKIRKLEEKIEAKGEGGSARQEASECLTVQGDSREETVTQVMMHEQDIESDGERAMQDADKQSEVAVARGDSQLIPHNLSRIAATSQDKVEVPDKPAEEQFVLDEETIKLLGDDPAAKKQAELKLNADVASRVSNWMIKGLPKELKESLLSKFPKEGNCYLEGPELNEGIAVTLNETAIKRDNHFKELHNVIGSALSASASAVTMLIEEDGQGIDKNQLLERVLGSAQLLAELFYTVSVAYIVPGFEKKTKTLFDKTTTGKFLFGENLGDKVKEVLAVEKIGKELKTPVITKKTPLRSSNALNFKSSTVRARETTQSNYKKGNHKAFVSFKSRSQSSQRPTSQSQNHRSRNQPSRRR